MICCTEIKSLSLLSFTCFLLTIFDPSLPQPFEASDRSTFARNLPDLPVAWLWINRPGVPVLLVHRFDYQSPSLIFPSV
ncbi:expressed protein [Phakopsora pachyrhizi]|uniref:Expressed protein n=1 Tax=Phakopsora pachyrhizi TaxID=170000 RepID=A0AAV0AX23_PHAPC|nr:expressed protein [Phakopsora pachyrhizi]